MKIKERKGNPLFRSIRLFFSNHFTLGRLIIVLIGILILLGISLSSIYLGMRIYQSGTAGSLNYKLNDFMVSRLNFVPSYFRGLWSKPDEFIIDIGFKDLEKIRYYRNKSLDAGYVLPEGKDDDIPATLTYNGETYEIKMSLTGFTLMHVGDAEKWSFRIKLKDDASILRMKEFNLLYPSSRGYLSDWIGHQLQKKLGIIAMRIHFVDVTVNGNNLGLYCLEESFDKGLIENNELKEGLVFKWGDSPRVYNLGKVSKEPGFREKSQTLKTLVKGFNTDETGIDHIFDLPKMAKFFAINDLLNGGGHGIYLSNTRFYFNPITNLIEPIGREWDLSAYKYEDRQNTMALGIEYAREFSPFFEKFFSDTTFIKLYINELKVLSEKEFLDNFFSEISEEMDYLTSKIYRDNPFYVYPKEFLYNNQNYIRSKIYPANAVAAYFEFGDEGATKVLVKNLQNFPVQISDIHFNDSILFEPPGGSSIILNGSNKNYEEIEFSIQSDVHPDTLDKIEISYFLPGIDSTYLEEVLPWPYLDNNSFSYNTTRQKPNYQKFEFLSLDNKTGNILFDKMEIELSEDLIFSEGHTIVVNEGTKINLTTSASIISYSPIMISGTKELPVIITSSDSTGQGIFVLNTHKESLLDYVIFENLRNPSKRGWGLTGAVTFYEADISINNCIFSNNITGDDYLNIVRSEFVIDNSTFVNIVADAFDSDFCIGSITNTRFINCGNDAIDISGTVINIEQVFIDNSGDKGLSAGENSQLYANGVEIVNSEIAICSKDMSTIVLSDVNLSNDKIGFTAFQKKSEFGPGEIKVMNLQLRNATLPYLIETNSTLTIDGAKKESDNERVKDVLYGVKYGKSSN